MRPDPILRIDTAFFWEACERGEFVAQKFNCAREGEACDTLWHRPTRCAPNAIPLKKKSKVIRPWNSCQLVRCGQTTGFWF